MTLAYFIVLGLTGFALALAVQMRFLISASFRRALAEEFGGSIMDAAHKQSVARTAMETSDDAGTQHLLQTYPKPVGYIRLARKVTTFTLPLIAVLLIVGRFGLNIF